ncbi:hypothetical protein H0H93_013059 [Arthromyces matolae]|nr:hypothetical protein H0H93_013059 [Arthromyces matolae]
MFVILFYLLGFLATTAIRATVIVPGASWTDTAGNAIQAHGGGFLKVGSVYYWFGEDKSLNSALFHAVSCYTSTDLMTWTRQNDALTPVAGTNISTSNIVERPKGEHSIQISFARISSLEIEVVYNKAVSYALVHIEHLISNF